MEILDPQFGIIIEGNFDNNTISIETNESPIVAKRRVVIVDFEQWKSFENSSKNKENNNLSYNPNQPMHPVTIHKVVDDEVETQYYTGVTKREYFAAMAMQGLLQNAYGNSPNHIAELSVKIADSLFIKLEQTNNINP